MTEEQYDALQDYKNPKNITPVFDFGYGMGSRMYGDGEYTYETRGVMNNLTSALLNGDKDSWAVLRDEWSSVIDEVIDGYNNTEDKYPSLRFFEKKLLRVGGEAFCCLLQETVL